MIKVFLKSILIGVANIIPGVSGGTVAVMLGMYDDIVNKIGDFLLVDIKTKINYAKYLIFVVLGAAVGVLLFSNIISFSITNYPKITSGVFTALVIPSIPYIIKGLDYKKSKNIISFFFGVILMLIFIYLNIKYGKKDTNIYVNLDEIIFPISYLIKILICGLLAAGAMIIPGISGSLLLLMLGEYYNIVSFISNFSIKPLFFLGLGVALGLVIFSKAISYLLKNYRETTLFFITGIVIMSIFQIWINI